MKNSPYLLPLCRFNGSEKACRALKIDKNEFEWSQVDHTDSTFHPVLMLDLEWLEYKTQIYSIENLARLWFSAL